MMRNVLICVVLCASLLQVAVAESKADDSNLLDSFGTGFELNEKCKRDIFQVKDQALGIAFANWYLLKQIRIHTQELIQCCVSTQEVQCLKTYFSAVSEHLSTLSGGNLKAILKLVYLLAQTALHCVIG